MTNELTLRDYLRVLWSGRLLVLAVVALAMVVAAIVTVARPTTYTATARLSLGQATTVSGATVQTPLTSSTTAPTTLKTDEMVRQVASRVGLSATAVRNAVTLSTPRVAANASNQATVLTITATSRRRDRSIAIANAYSDVVFATVDKPYRAVYDSLVARRKNALERIDSLNREITRLRQLVVASAGTDRGAIVTSALYSALDQLDAAQLEVEDAELRATKAEQVEAPQQLAVAESATSSGAAPRRIRSITLAGIIGLIVGIFATFVWKGSPAGASPRDGTAV